MKLSIIVPVYKVEPFLRRCVDSILAQTFTDFELILVDDGSPDGCPAICDEYAEKDPRVNVIHQKNGGPSAARNVGLDIAKGEYIGFVDGDDIIHPKMFEVLLHIAKKENVDISACDIHHFFSDSVKFEQIRIENIQHVQRMDRKELFSNFYNKYRYLLRTELVNKVYKKKIFDHIRLPVGRFYEDAYVQIPLLDAAQSVAYIPDELYYYFQRPGSTMHAKYDIWCANDMDEVSRYNLQHFRQTNDTVQVLYALEDYLTMFCRDKIAVYLQYPQLREPFKNIEKTFNKEFFHMLFDPKICKMKKVVLLLLRVHVPWALWVCQRFLPDCLHRFMR